VTSTAPLFAMMLAGLGGLLFVAMRQARR